MKDGRQTRRSDLFLLRVWVEQSSGENAELRGKIQRAVSGEAHYFHNLPELADLLRAMVPGHPKGTTPHPQQPVAHTGQDKENSYVGATGEEVATPVRSE